jgi:hypothetical protein
MIAGGKIDLSIDHRAGVILFKSGEFLNFEIFEIFGFLGFLEIC